MLAHASEPPQLKTASTHPIQYYLSLPDGWVEGKKWPVVVVIDSADREFLQAATDFAQARQQRPFEFLPAQTIRSVCPAIQSIRSCKRP
jgi:hypothetical protein